MRRCKYFWRETSWLPRSFDNPDNLESCTFVTCDICRMTVWNIDECKEHKLECYTPVDIDPYWKGVITETNKRINRG